MESRRVLWAGDSAGGLRLAVVAGANDAQPSERDPDRQTDLGALNSTAIAIFAGPAGTPVELLRLVAVPRGHENGRPFAFRDATTGTALVLAAPGDYIEVAHCPDITADGTESWDVQPFEAADGSALLVTEHGYAMRFRVRRDERTLTAVEGFDTIVSDPRGVGDLERVAADVDVRTVRPEAEPSPDGGWTIDSQAAQLVMRSGLPPEQVDVVIPWTGPVPSRDGVPTRRSR